MQIDSCRDDNALIVLNLTIKEGATGRLFPLVLLKF